MGAGKGETGCAGLVAGWASEGATGAGAGWRPLASHAGASFRPAAGHLHRASAACWPCLYSLQTMSVRVKAFLCATSVCCARALPVRYQAAWLCVSPMPVPLGGLGCESIPPPAIALASFPGCSIRHQGAHLRQPHRAVCAAVHRQPLRQQLPLLRLPPGQQAPRGGGRGVEEHVVPPRQRS